MKTSPNASQSLLTSAATIKKLFCGGVVAALMLLSVLAENPNEGVTVTTTNTVSVLVATNLVGKTFVFMGRKASRTNNTGIVWIQRTSTNAFGGIPIYPGQLLSIPVATDRAVKVDFWITADTSGDGVVWQVYQ
jgi:hypothetical protein